MNVHIKQNSITNIDLNIGRYISDNYYRKFYTIDKNLECGYYLVKFTSDSYTLQYFREILKYLIKYGEMMCDSVYISIQPSSMPPYHTNSRMVLFQTRSIG